MEESPLSRVIYLKIRTLWVWEVVFKEYEKCFIPETEMFEARGARTERTSGAFRCLERKGISHSLKGLVT